MAETVRMTAHFSGYVQGVGFRFTAVRVARTFPDVHGYVRNLPDGRVELVAEGVRRKTDAFLSAVRDEMSSCIRDASVAYSMGTREFRGFNIAY